MTNDSPVLTIASRQRWRAAAASVRGAAHRRRSRANQDAVILQQPTAVAPWPIVAVADGHGSPDCPRSRTGARLAVRSAACILHSFATAQRYSSQPQDAFLQPRLRESLVRHWRQAVADHLRRHPWPRLAEPPHGEPAYLAYGTTLLAALALSSHLFFFQIGDGDILSVSADGSVRSLWDDSEPSIGEETPSLCLPNAEQWMRAAVLPVSADGPEMILLATDGYAKSFATRQDFLQVGSDLRDCRKGQGWPALLRQLPAWLRETSEAGSGDDISVGILSRI